MSGSLEIAYLGLGSNLGDREGSLRSAAEALDGLAESRVTGVSSVYETAAWGLEDQPDFLNAAVALETGLEPVQLLAVIGDIERELGREPGVQWGPRIIDIDLILYGDRIMDTPTLTMPHREFRNRAFVLAPLAEIAGDAVDPVTGLTVRELAAAPEAAGEVTRLERPLR